MEDSAIFEPDLVLAGPGSTVLGGFPEYGMAAIGLTGLDCPANSRSIQGYSGEYFPAIYGHKTASWCRTLQNTCLDISCSTVLRYCLSQVPCIFISGLYRILVSPHGNEMTGDVGPKSESSTPPEGTWLIGTLLTTRCVDPFIMSHCAANDDHEITRKRRKLMTVGRDQTA